MMNARSSDRNNNLSPYKWTVFIAMYLGYTVYMLDRKCFSFAAPAIVEEEDLDKDDLGLVTSSLSLAYAVSKFSSGVAADKLNPKSLFNVGLLASGVVILLFSVCSSVPVYASLWFVCGIVQGAGWPACAKMLRQWFSKNEFGTWWSILSTSMNLAGSVGPILASYLMIHYGWRTSMHVFGTLSLGMVALCSFALVESPESVGLVSAQADGKSGDDKGRVRGRGTWQDLLRSPLMWLLCCGYAVVFMVRTAAQDWGQLYLIQDCGQSQYIGSLFLSFLELGGVLGSILAGILSDKMMAWKERLQWLGTPRLTVVTAFLVTSIASLHIITQNYNEDSSDMFIAISGFALGASLYGPIALYGVMAIEAAPTHIAGTSQAIVALAANIGAVMAGLPFSIVATHFQWKGAFVMSEALLVVIAIVMVMFRNIEYKMIPIKKKLH